MIESRRHAAGPRRRRETNLRAVVLPRERRDHGGELAEDEAEGRSGISAVARVTSFSRQKDKCEAEDVLRPVSIDVKRSPGAVADLIIARTGVAPKSSLIAFDYGEDLFVEGDVDDSNAACAAWQSLDDACGDVWPLSYLESIAPT